MPAVSKKQQKFMGIVRAIQKGEESASKFSKDAQDAAKSMKKSSVKKYAKTKHGDLPVKKESISKSQIKKMRDEFDKTGELPPHLKKIAKGKKEFEKKFKVKDIEIPGLEWMKKLGEAADRDYKAEYKKFQSSTKSKKYRAELNKYNRKKGTYGNGDGKDASHKGGKIVGFESQSKNRGRAEKSRLKKESPDFNPMIDAILDEVIDEYQINEGTNQMTQVYKDLDKKFKKYDHTRIQDFGKVSKYLKTKFSKGSSLPDTVASFYNDYRGGEDMKKNIDKLTKYAKKMGGYKKESVKEADLGLTYKKGKTVKVKHKTSGKSLVIVDKPNVRKEYEKMGYFAESVNEGQKKFASTILNKFDQAYLKFSREVRDVIKMMDRSTGDKTDGKIIDKAYSKGLIPLDELMQSWGRGQQSNPKIDEKVIKVSKKDDVPGNAMKMRGEEKIKKITYSGSNGKGGYEIKGKNLNVIGIRPRDKGFFVRHFTNNTGFRKANLYYDGVNFMDKTKKF